MTDFISDVMDGWRAGGTLIVLGALILFAGEWLLLCWFNIHMASGGYPAPHGPRPRLGRARQAGMAWFAEREHWIVFVGAFAIMCWGIAFSLSSGEETDFGRSGSLITILGLVAAFLGTRHAEGLLNAHTAIDPPEAAKRRLEHNERADGLSKGWMAMIVFLGTVIWGYGDLAIKAACPPNYKLRWIGCYKPPDPPRPPPPVAPYKVIVPFALDKWIIVSEEQKRPIRKAAEYALKNTGMYVYIIGHADSSGTAGHNMDVSARRTNSVAIELGGLGVPEERLVTSFQGAAVPAAPEGKNGQEPKNRRVDIIIR